MPLTTVTIKFLLMNCLRSVNRLQEDKRKYMYVANKEEFPKLYKYKLWLLVIRLVQFVAIAAMLVLCTYELLHYMLSYDKSYVWIIAVACDLLWLFLAVYEEILYSRLNKSSEHRRYIEKYRKPMKK